MNAELSRGWTAWHDFWAAKTYALTTLRRVAGRLRVPELAYAYAVWVEEIEEQKRQLSALRRRKHTESLEQENARLREELMAAKETNEAKLAAVEAKRAELAHQVSFG